ncbi:MAG: GDP-mannose 4,6-dehydratase [Solirubrobacteraceae bacterium]
MEIDHNADLGWIRGGHWTKSSRIWSTACGRRIRHPAPQMRFLITGGAGFIGSHLCDELLARGHRVEVLDDLSTGSMDNIAHLRDEPRFACTVASARREDVVEGLVATADVVVHLAAAVGVELIVQSPVRTIETNVHCTEVVLAQAARHRRPVIVASTSEVYGKSSALPFREDGDLVFGPTTTGRWAYACSKAIDEFLAIAYWTERKHPTMVVRLFNTVGPRQTGQYGMVIPRFVRNALSGRDLQVYGDGTQTRCFCHVQDVIAALVGLIQSQDHWGEVFNVGSAEEVSIAALAERVVHLTGSSSSIARLAYEDAYEAGFEDIVRRVPDTTKIEAALGWAPERSLDDVLRDVIDHEKTKVVL